MMITRICKKGKKDTNVNAEREKNNGRENKRVQVFFSLVFSRLPCY